MSIERCRKHGRRYDTDFADACAMCVLEKDQARGVQYVPSCPECRAREPHVCHACGAVDEMSHAVDCPSQLGHALQVRMKTLPASWPFPRLS